MITMHSKRLYLDQLKTIINYQGISSQKLHPSMIFQYQFIIQLLCELLNKIEQKDEEQLTKQMIKQSMRIIKQNNRELNINFITKKLFFLQFYIQYMCIKNRCTEKLQQHISKEINQILKQDLVLILRKKGKVSSSLQKITSFIRDLSSSRRSSSKIKVQGLDDTLKTIVNQILSPYCSYILKIINSNDIYTSILNKQEQKFFSNQLIWKAINWSISLSKIIRQLNKIGKYFKDDFQAIWVFLYYIISQDMSKYYQILREKVERQSNKWLDRLLLTKKFYKINKNSFLFLPQELKELENLKKQIEQISLIRQDLNYLYINKHLTQWKSAFQPVSMKAKILKSTASDQLLNIIGALTKYKEFSFLNETKRNPTETQGQSGIGITQASQNISSPITQGEQQLKRQPLSNELQVETRRNVFTQKRVRLIGRM